jgi:hypothetical protein
MLTDVGLRNARPREKAFKLSDEKGLYLLVETSGSKLWRLKYRFAMKKLALGAYLSSMTFCPADTVLRLKGHLIL